MIKHLRNYKGYSRQFDVQKILGEEALQHIPLQSQRGQPKVKHVITLGVSKVGQILRA